MHYKSFLKAIYNQSEVVIHTAVTAATTTFTNNATTI